MKSVPAYSLVAKMREVRDLMKCDHVPSRQSWLKLNVARVKRASEKLSSGWKLWVETLEHEFPF